MAEGGNSAAYSDMSEVVQNLQQLDLAREDKINFEETLFNAHKKVALVCQPLEDLQQTAFEESHYLDQAHALLKCQLNLSEQRLAEVRRKNKERAAYHAACLAAQEKEYQAKVAQLKTIRKEIDHYGNVLRQKEAEAAGHHEHLKAESGEMAKRNQVLKRLRSKLNSRTSKFQEDQENLKSTSSELDNVISDLHKEIQDLRESITKKTKQLEAVKADNVIKAAKLVTTRSKTEDIVAKAERLKVKGLKIKTEFEAIEKKQKDEIAGLEERLAEERAKYEDVNKVYTDLTDRINAECGSSKPLEEMTIDARTELQRLDMERSRLNERIDAICQSMRSNETKLAELSDAKNDFLRQLDMDVEIAETLSESQSSQYRRKRSQIGSSTGSKRSEKEEPIFMMPRGIPKKGKRTQKRKQEEDPEQQADCGGVVQSADSSVVDLGTTTFELSTVVEGVEDPNQSRDYYANLAMFGDHFLGKTN